MSYKGTQFSSSSMVEFCKHLDIQNQFILVEHPQVNGQTKATNKIILVGAVTFWKYLFGNLLSPLGLVH